MSLVISHNTFSGAYTAYMRLRSAWFIAAGFGDDPTKLLLRSDCGGEIERWQLIDPNGEDPLVDLLLHSDCGGEIKPDDARRMADRLEGLLPLLDGGGGGHLEHQGGIHAVTTRFIAGLRRAADAGENLVFH